MADYVKYTESVQLEGFRELYDRIMTAEPRRIKPALRTALRGGAKAVLAEAKSRVPVKTGALKKSHKVKATPKIRKGSVSISVLTSKSGHMFKGDQYYGGIIHYGSQKRNIKPRPWLRESFDATKSQALAAIKAALSSALAKLGV